MTDQELLVLAAKAVGGIYDHGTDCISSDGGIEFEQWEPLTDAGDALRLAVALELDVQFFRIPAEVHVSTLNDAPVHDAIEPYGDDRGAATRRAITRAAAAIGEAMP